MRWCQNRIGNFRTLRVVVSRPKSEEEAITLNTDEASDANSASRFDIAKDQWGNVIRVQIHFNEAIQRTRQLTATAVLATYGASLAYFSSKTFNFLVVPYTGVAVHFATPLVVLAWVFLFVGYMLDRHYYFRMLVAAVDEAAQAEQKFDFPIKLSTRLLTAVKPRQAKRTIAIFYGSAVLIGVVIIWAINRLTVLGVSG